MYKFLLFEVALNFRNVAMITSEATVTTKYKKSYINCTKIAINFRISEAAMTSEVNMTLTKYLQTAMTSEETWDWLLAD